MKEKTELMKEFKTEKVETDQILWELKTMVATNTTKISLQYSFAQ